MAELEREIDDLDLVSPILATDTFPLSRDGSAKRGSALAVASYVIALLTSGSPTALDTWLEIVARLEDDEDALASLLAQMAGKVDTSALQTIITNDDAKVPTSGAVVDYVAAQNCVLQYVYNEYTASVDLTTVIPYDDTIPQVTEGTQVLSVTITPRSSTNRVIIRGALTGAVGTAANALSMAVFVNGGTDAIFASSTIMGGANYVAGIPFEFQHSPGSTSPQTYTVRVGPSGGTARLNGSSVARRFGSVSKCTLIAEERVA